MSVFDNLVKHGMPMVPKPIVGRVARRYVAGETLDGKRDEAAAMYQSVGKAELPKHFRIAATHGAIQARQPSGTQGK